MSYVIFMPRWFDILKEVRGSNTALNVSKNLKISTTVVYGMLHKLESEGFVVRSGLGCSRKGSVWCYTWCCTVKGKVVVDVLKGVF